MSLSVCLMTTDPPSRIAAILEPLRPYAEEIVIATDARIDNGVLADYSLLADRLFRVDFRSQERHLDWLNAQCHEEWILRLDGDELVSPAFTRRLPKMLESRTVREFWIARRWLFGDAEHYLAEQPWSVDFVSRLVRNDGTPRSPDLEQGDAAPAVPREYVRDPLYRFALLLQDVRQRRDEAIRREVAQPGRLAANGARLNESFYLPELQSSPRLGEVSEEDRASIVNVLKGSPANNASTTPIQRTPVVSLAEMDRMWAGRTVREDAYRAKIDAYEPAASFAPAESRTVFFDVTNEGTEHWPASLEQAPLIRLGCRWLNTDGTLHTEAGPRSPFPRPVGPGERILTPVTAQAPARAGDYLLEVDVVHEDVRWFDCCARIPARVLDPQKASQGVTAIRETPRPTHQRWRRMQIPRTFHRVWLGQRQMPAEEVRFGATFTQHHPDWTMRLWTEEDLQLLDITDTDRERARSASELSNLVRYEVLHRFGGIYIDTDFECLRPLTPVLRGIDAFGALEAPGRVGVAILGSVAKHPLFARAARLSRYTLGVGAHSADANGPYLFSLILEQDHDLAIFAAHMFYPYRWDEPLDAGASFPDAYAVHHWSKSWVEEEQGA
jgi:hypothetical protein